MGENWRFAPENQAEYANLAWWRQFDDPVLDELIQKALDNNQDLQTATARVAEFYARYREVFAELFPELYAAGGLDRIKQSEDISFFPVLPHVPRINNLYHLFLKISYEFDFWGKIRNAAEAAKDEYLSKIEAKRTVIVSLVSAVAIAYLQLKQYDNQLAISRSTLASRMESWEIAKLRFEAGLVSEMEANQAEAEAESAATQVTNFEALVPRHENLISVLIGEAPSPIPRGPLLTELKMPPTIPAGIPSDLLENRPDIREAEQKLLSTNAAIGAARALFFPSIALTGTAGQLSTLVHDFFDNSASFFDLALHGLQPLFTGGKIVYQVKLANALMEEALHSYQQTILTALREVEDALVSHQKAKEKLEILKRQTAALQEYLNLAILRYMNGQNDYLTVLNAQSSLFRVQLEEAEAETDVFTSLITLYKALGQGWQAAEEPACEPCETQPQSEPAELTGALNQTS
jgi:multidrug efflux system outer membrane protein